MSGSADAVVRTSEPAKLRVVRRVREVYDRREVLLNLVRKELKVKYTASIFGAVWSLLNPIVFLAVFTFVVRVTNTSFPHFPVYLLAGLLAWNMFSVSLSGGARSVIDNANLVKKVSFPREVLPLSAVGVALVDFVLQSVVFLLFILVSGYGFHLPELAIYPLAFATLLVFTLALTFWLAALNVRYRDVQHLLNIALLVWFWMTPIVYSGFVVKDVLAGRKILGVSLWGLYLANPLAPIALGFQRALYGVVRPVVGERPVLPDVSLAWLAGVLAIVLALSVAFLLYTWRRFFELSGDFAEEL